MEGFRLPAGMCQHYLRARFNGKLCVPASQSSTFASKGQVGFGNVSALWSTGTQGCCRLPKCSVSDCRCKLAPGFVPMLDQMSLGEVPEPPKCALEVGICELPPAPFLASEGLGVLGAQQWRWTGWAWLSLLREGSPRSQVLPRSGWWRLRDRSPSAVAGTLRFVSGGPDGGSPVDRRPCAGVVWVVSPSRPFWS